MKRIILPLLAFFLFSGSLYSQSPTLPKLRVNNGFFSTKYELGDKDIKEKEVALHLEKYSAESYHLWKRSNSLGIQSTIYSIIGAGAFITGFAISENNPKGAVTSYLVSAGAFTASLVTYLGYASKRDKAINTYNKFAGY